jgi:hypothetical protein
MSRTFAIDDRRIKAERRFDGREGDEVIAAERLHGAFTRQLFLGDKLDAERLEASYETEVHTADRQSRYRIPQRPRRPRAGSSVGTAESGRWRPARATGFR